MRRNCSSGGAERTDDGRAFRLDHAKCDCRRHRLENENVDEKYVVVQKIQKVVVVVHGSHRLQKTEL